MSLMYMDKNASAVRVPTDEHLDPNSTNALSNAGFCEAINALGGSGIKYQCGYGEICPKTTSINNFSVVFDEPFSKVPVVLISSVIEYNEAFGYGIGLNIATNSITENGFTYQIGNRDKATVPNRISWIAMEV